MTTVHIADTGDDGVEDWQIVKRGRWAYGFDVPAALWERYEAAHAELRAASKALRDAEAAASEARRRPARRPA